MEKGKSAESSVFSFRIKPDTAAAIKRAAKNSRISVSDYMDALVLRWKDLEPLLAEMTNMRKEIDDLRSELLEFSSADKQSILVKLEAAQSETATSIATLREQLSKENVALRNAIANALKVSFTQFGADISSHIDNKIDARLGAELEELIDRTARAVLLESMALATDVHETQEQRVDES